MRSWSNEMPQAVDGAKEDEANVITVLRDLLERAERGELTALVAVYTTSANTVGSVFSGNDDIVRRAGMLAIAQADLVNVRNQTVSVK